MELLKARARRAGRFPVRGLVLSLIVLACSQGRSYEARGVVEAVMPEQSQLVVAHQEIVGLMGAMTMSFDVADDSLLAGLEPGRTIDFTLSVSSSGFRITRITPTGWVEESAEWARFGAGLVRADPAPEFELIDQAGEAVSLAGLAGKNLLVDFVFTRCEGPCPILTAKHVAVQRQLPPEVADESWFVSISLDPTHDGPEEMTAYADARGVDLSNWSFLTGEEAIVASVVKRYGVGTTRAEDGSIEHMLVAFLVDSKGRIVKRYLGLEHASDAIAADMAALVF